MTEREREQWRKWRKKNQCKKCQYSTRIIGDQNCYYSVMTGMSRITTALQNGWERPADWKECLLFKTKPKRRRRRKKDAILQRV